MELLHGLIVLITLKQDFCQNGSSLVILWIDLEQDSAQLFASLDIALSHLQVGKHLQSLLVLFVLFETLVEHKDSCVDILLVVVCILCDLKEDIGFCKFFFLSCPTFASYSLNDYLLELSRRFYMLSGFFIDTQVVRALLFYVELVKLKIRLDVLLESVSRSILFCKYLAG